MTLTLGALFGFFAYATYDLTNLATLRGWPVGLSLIDIGLGHGGQRGVGRGRQGGAGLGTAQRRDSRHEHDALAAGLAGGGDSPRPG